MITQGGFCGNWRGLRTTWDEGRDCTCEPPALQSSQSHPPKFVKRQKIVNFSFFQVGFTVNSTFFWQFTSCHQVPIYDHYGAEAKRGCDGDCGFGDGDDDDDGGDDDDGDGNGNDDDGENDNATQARRAHNLWVSHTVAAAIPARDKNNDRKVTYNDLFSIIPPPKKMKLSRS